jgi:hypothetical protein
MGDLSAHFSRAEFACKCGCGFDAVDVEMLRRSELLRDIIKAPITPNCGDRCVKHNDKLPSRGYPASKTSWHMWAKAIDWPTPVGWTPERLALACRYAGWQRVLIYTWGCHVDDKADDILDVRGLPTVRIQFNVLKGLAWE